MLVLKSMIKRIHFLVIDFTWNYYTIAFWQKWRKIINGLRRTQRRLFPSAKYMIHCKIIKNICICNLIREIDCLGFSAVKSKLEFEIASRQLPFWETRVIKDDILIRNQFFSDETNRRGYSKRTSILPSLFGVISRRAVATRQWN